VLRKCERRDEYKYRGCTCISSVKRWHHLLNVEKMLLSSFTFTLWRSQKQYPVSRHSCYVNGPPLNRNTDVYRVWRVSVTHCFYAWQTSFWAYIITDMSEHWSCVEMLALKKNHTFMQCSIDFYNARKVAEKSECETRFLTICRNMCNVLNSIRMQSDDSIVCCLVCGQIGSVLENFTQECRVCFKNEAV
jgi:hypothetical protein